MKRHSIYILVIMLVLSCLIPMAKAVSYNAYINSNTKVYRLPTTSSQSLSVGKGLKVKVTAYQNGWCRVGRGNVKAYIPAKYLTAATAARIDSVLMTAMNQVGKRYGRNPPYKFDCSALVQYCFGKSGYSTSGTAAAIASDNRYPKVKKSNLVKGDIICMDANSDHRCDHVGIYMGRGYMIEASFTAGMVRVKKLNSWYMDHTMFARRVS